MRMPCWWPLAVMALLMLGMVRPAGASAIPDAVYSTVVPEVGDPEIVGWFCPECGGLVSMGSRSCGCGYSLDGGTDDDDDDDTGGGYTGGGTSGGGYTAPKPPAPPPVSPEERRQKEIYARERQALLDAFKLPAAATPAPVVAVTIPTAPTAFTEPAQPVRFQQASGLSEAEWARARAAQATIDALTRTWPVPAKELPRLENALIERNTLWAKATSAPGLTAEERERLRLKLFIVPMPGKGAVMTATALDALSTTPPPPPAPTNYAANPIAAALMRQASIDNAVALAELGGEQWAEGILDDDMAGRYGTVLGLAKVAVAAREDTAEGLAALGDVLVGLIPLPQTNVALTGGRQYANLTYQTLNHFMSRAMQVTGGTFDAEAFWKEFDSEASVHTRAYRKWIGFGP